MNAQCQPDVITCYAVRKQDAELLQGNRAMLQTDVRTEMLWLYALQH